MTSVPTPAPSRTSCSAGEAEAFWPETPPWGPSSSDRTPALASRPPQPAFGVPALLAPLLPTHPRHALLRCFAVASALARFASSRDRPCGSGQGVCPSTSWGRGLPPQVRGGGRPLPRAGCTPHQACPLVSPGGYPGPTVILTGGRVGSPP